MKDPKTAKDAFDAEEIIQTDPKLRREMKATVKRMAVALAAAIAKKSE